MTPAVLYSLLLALLSCSGWHLEPTVGYARGLGDLEPSWGTVEVAMKKDQTVTVLPAPVTVVSSEHPLNLSVGSQNLASETEQQPDDVVRKTVDAGTAVDAWATSTKVLFGVLGLAVLVGGVWLASKDKLPIFRRKDKSGE